MAQRLTWNQSNNPTIADWLIHSGADVNANSETYGRAIHIAVEFGFVDLVDMLLHQGAEVYADSPNGYPLQIARQEWMQSCTSERQRRFQAILDLLRNAGAADEEARAASTSTYDHLALASPAPRTVIGSTESWIDCG
jgi:ankyrin repeat protein